MLTRAQAKATNQHVFVDDKWNDAFIQTKDEQIEMLHAQRVLKSWEDDADSEAEEEAARVAEALVDGADPAGDDDDDSDRWVSESDTEDEEDDAQATPHAGEDAEALKRAERLRRRRSSTWLAGGGLVENVAWTAAVVTVVPVVLYAAVARCTRRRKTKSKSIAWPLESRSLRGVLVKATTNVATLVILLAVAGWAVCGCDVSPSSSSLASLFHWRSLLRQWKRVDTCAASFAGDWRNAVGTVASAGVVTAAALPSLRLALQTTVLVVVALLLTRFHRLWLKSVVLLTTLSLLSVRLVADLRAEQRSSIEIVALDPSFAFANESIFIAVDGQNLEQGATIAWVPFWGSDGLQQHKAFEIAKLFPQPLRNGGVRVAFDQLNEFVPCYATPAQDRDFKCFEHLRLRVKDQKSVPGWSLHAHSEL